MMKAYQTVAALVLTATIGCGCTTFPTISTKDGRGNATDISAMTFLLDKAVPTIIYVPGCGIAEATSMDWARRINSWGYNAVIAEDLEQRGMRSACTAFGIQDVAPQERMESVVQTAQWVGTQPWHTGKIGMIGFGVGASTTLNIGANRKPIGALEPLDSPINAGVSYYPHCQTYHSNPNIPMQIHIGQSDDWTRSEGCQALRNYRNYDVNVYDGAQHGFDAPGFDGVNRFGHMMKYEAETSRIAEEKTRQFFLAHIKTQ